MEIEAKDVKEHCIIKP